MADKKNCKNIQEFIDEAATHDGKAFGFLEAKITEVAEKDVNKKDGTTGHVHELTVEDATGTIKVSVWDSDQAWKAGDVFSGTNLYTSTFKGDVQLNVTKQGKVSKKLATSAKAATAKPTSAVTQPTSAVTQKTGCTTTTTGGSSLNMIALEKKIDNLKGELLNAFKQFQVVVLDQIKELATLVGGQPAAEAGTEGEEPPQEGS